MGAFDRTDLALGRYKNAEEALMMLVDANDKLETLEGLYTNSKYSSL